MRFMCTPATFVASCVFARVTTCRGLHQRRFRALLATVAHCCVPIAHYRMARTIRFHLRSPRYFHRASPIPLRSIRRSIGRNDGKGTRLLLSFPTRQ